MTVQQNAGLSGVPHPDERWSDQVKAEWWVYLESPLAKSISDVDANALRRLFGYYHAYWVAYSGLMDDIADMGAYAFVAQGSRGQEQLSPLMKVLEKLEASIQSLETKFAISPLVRARLGIDVGRGEKAKGEGAKTEVAVADADLEM